MSKPTGNELSRGLKDGLRLACQTRVLGNVEVELFYKPRLKVSHYSYNIILNRIDPIFSLQDIATEKLPLHSQEEVIISQENCFGSKGKVLLIRSHPISTTIVDNDNVRILLMDLGTTKIAYQVIDLKGDVHIEKTIVNPLTRYGADIITRLSKIIEQPEKEHEMRALLLDIIEKIHDENSGIVLTAFAGNSVNQSILLGLPVDKLAVKPYQPYLKGPFIGVLGKCKPFYAAPFIGGFVGADAFSNMAAVEYMGLDKPYIIIDIGTNTEVIVGTGRLEDPIYATSTPAGPAFEGHVESGAGVGLPGIYSVKIKRVEADKIVFEYMVDSESKPAGLLGSGIISLASELLRNKVIDNRGRILRGYRRVNGIKTIVVASADETITNKPIIFTQLDVRELQKALAAVKTSWQLLLRESNIRVEDLKWVVLTGTFGSSISIKDAVLLGLIPRVPEERVLVAGNMVLSGLKTLVLDRRHEERMRGYLERTNSIDLAELEDFTSTWIKNLEFSMHG